MNDRHATLLQAAQVVFSRYGVSKSTMNDIAREAGVARQTLYNAYPSKEAVLRATLHHGADKTFAAVDARWAVEETFAEKLETFFELGPLYWYDVVQSSPEAADLLDGIHAVAHDELIALAKIWNTRFEALIKMHIPEGLGQSIDAAQMADFIYSASMNAKYNAESRAVIVARLNVLKSSVLALLAVP